jgi:hypothetical protein
MKNNNLYKLIIYLNPNAAFEQYLDYLSEDMLETELTLILFETRKKLFYSGNWDKTREDLVRNALNNLNYYNGYNRAYTCQYPKDFNFFTNFLK